MRTTPPAWRPGPALLHAAAKDHDVLLVDEALATGDRSFQKRSEERIRELRKHAGTLVSHSNKSIRDTCDRCCGWSAASCAWTDRRRRS
ncbi:hypothetical protein STENM36S_00242 [Streptomyces tendae]